MPEKSERDWRAEMDARTLADAAAIEANPDRKKKAATAAKRLVSEEEKRAKEQAAQAAAMKRLANAQASAEARGETRRSEASCGEGQTPQVARGTLGSCPR